MRFSDYRLKRPAKRKPGGFFVVCPPRRAEVIGSGRQPHGIGLSGAACDYAQERRPCERRKERINRPPARRRANDDHIGAAHRNAKWGAKYEQAQHANYVQGYAPQSKVFDHLRPPSRHHEPTTLRLRPNTDIGEHDDRERDRMAERAVLPQPSDPVHGNRGARDVRTVLNAHPLHPQAEGIGHMTDWQDIDSAPLDRPIVGINADGEESPMFSEKVHPKVDARFWCKGQDRSNPNWVKSECFYPVKWREPDAG